MSLNGILCRRNKFGYCYHSVNGISYGLAQKIFDHLIFFQDVIASNGDLGKRITYLKVDVEGSELKSISEWIASGILDDVRQIGIEIHTAQDFVQGQGESNVKYIRL